LDGMRATSVNMKPFQASVSAKLIRKTSIALHSRSVIGDFADRSQPYPPSLSEVLRRQARLVSEVGHILGVEIPTAAPAPHTGA
jgi:hypothetical protein